MSFIQPFVLWALPLALLPVIIHLVHKRRHRVVEWGAMMFLLDGAKLSKGRQRLREILLLVMRTLAVLGLIVGLGRPLAGGWAGSIAGESAGTVILVLDRSASMSSAAAQGRAETKLAAGVRALEGALEIARPGELLVIDTTRPAVATPLEGHGDLALLGLDRTTEAAGDVPAAIETAVGYLSTASAGRTEIWVVSDGQGADWGTEDGRWSALTSAMEAHPAGVRVRLSLAGGGPSVNASVRVERARREVGPEGAELVLDVVANRTGGEGDEVLTPMAVVVGGARTSVDIEFSGAEARLQGLRIPLDEGLESGFGFVELQADGRPADDRFYFVFGDPQALEIAVVAERSDVMRVTSIAAELPFDPSVELAARTLSIDDVAGPEDLGLASAAALIWQAPLPTDDELRGALEAFATDGGSILFLPPGAPGDGTFQGAGWDTWNDVPPGQMAGPSTWAADDDLLASGLDGVPLPMGEVEIRRWCGIAAAADEDAPPLRTLAALEDGDSLLARSSREGGGVWFLGLLPTAESSNLATQGIVLVAMVQRMIEQGARSRGSGAQQDTGPADWLTAGGGWTLASQLEGGATLADVELHAAVVTDGETFVARNRPLAEDVSAPGATEAIRDVFGGLDVVVEEASGSGGVASGSGLLEEIWRLFLVLALAGLLAEALLCSTEGDAPRRTEGAA